MASGLIGLRSFIPVPCSKETFSSSVISFTTSAARSSGDRLVFIHGALPGEPGCAEAGSDTTLMTRILSASRLIACKQRCKSMILLLSASRGTVELVGHIKVQQNCSLRGFIHKIDFIR